MISKYGKVFPEGTTELDIELWCYAHDDREEGERGRLTKWDHFRNAVDLLWNVPGSSRRVIWNDWTERMLKGMIYNRYTALAGAASCVSGDTRLLDPLTGESPTIQDLCENGIRPTVMTVNGPVLADVPYVKGHEELFEFTLSNGEKFKCTMGHRLLTPSGWIRAGDASVGSLLFGYVPSHLPTTSGIVRQDQRRDVLHCSETLEDLRGGYSVYSRLCGEQLQLARDSALAPLPSQDDVRKYNVCDGGHLDVLLRESGYTHPCPQVGLSMRSAFLRGACMENASRFLSSSETSSPQFDSFRSSSLFESANSPIQPFEGLYLNEDPSLNKDCAFSPPLELGRPSYSNLSEQSSPRFQDGQQQDECFSSSQKDQQSSGSSGNCAYVSSSLEIQLVEVVSIEFVGVQTFYDLNVPIEHHYFAEGAIHHNSGKSDAAAVFCLVEWLAAPTETLCLVLSTTIAGAKKRIWKSVVELWNALEARWEREGVMIPGKIVDSKNLLKGMDINGKWSEGIGISLLAADKDNEKEASKKLKGLKAPAEGRGRLRVVADEFSDLGDSVLTAMVGNLNTNPDFKGIGMANPGSKLTPFGRFATPKDGWSSVSVLDNEWQTKLGICLRFDSLYSPRILTPEHEDEKNGTHSLYGWMASRQAIEQARTELGEESVEFWAQFRGMFCPTGMERTVWSENELLEAMAPVGKTEWDPGEQVRLIALDPAFTTDGDRSPIMWAECGKIKGKKVMNVLGYRISSEGASGESEEDKLLTVSERVIGEFKQMANDLSISPARAGYDCTGGGVVFGQWITRLWSGAVKGVNFAGAPIQRRADAINEETIYGNRVTQLWAQPKALVREGQIRGIPLEVIEELCLRKYDSKKQGSKTFVETKRDMKKRTGKSPDLADTFVILVEVAIANGLLDIVEIRKSDQKAQQAWKERVHQMGIPTARKSIIAMPMAKRLKTTRR